MADSLEHELTAHASALRSMARLLVGEQEADDLVQDTALQALGRPPSQPSGLRGWLLAVLRHRASKHRRAERRRQQREGALALPDDVASPFKIAEHKETLVHLHATLMALPEPYLGTLLLRFFVDLTPTQIAAHTGVPLATVKSRLQRGLALLRERLEAAQPRGWRAALGAAFGLEQALPFAAGMAVTSTGVLLMGSGVKFALGGVAAAVIAAWLWLGSEAPPTSPAAPGTNPDSSTVAIASIEQPSLVDRAEPTRADASVRTPVPAARVTIHGRCVDERGAGLANLTIELRGKRVQGGMGKDFEREYGEWLLQRGKFDWQDLAASTTADGRFEFAVEPSPLVLSLRVQRDGLEHSFSLGQQLRPEDIDLGDLLVPIGCTLRVSVVDGNGVPVLSPSLRITENGRPQQGRVFQAWPGVPILASDGSSTLAVATGSYSCQVHARAIARGELCTVPPGVSRHEHTIVVAALPTREMLTGIVVDEHELPLAGVYVSAYNSDSSFACAATDADGRFTVYRPASGGPTASLQFGKDGYLSMMGSRPFQFGELELRFTMHAAASLEVHVVEAGSNRPVEDFQVRLWPAPGNTASIFRNEGQYRCSGHHPDGITQVTDLPYGDQLLLVEPHRWDLWRSALVPVQIAPQGRARIEVRLGPSAERLLCVRRSDGAPVDDAEVEVVEQAEHALTLATPIKDFEQWWSPGDAPEGRLLVQRGSTDEHGQLQLHGPVDRAVALRITANGFATQIVESASLTDRSPLVVTLAIGARLVAQIGPPEFVAELRKACGLPLTGPAPRATRRNQPGFRLCRGAWPQLDIWPPADQKALLVAGDGMVVLEGAPPGDWQLGLESWDELPKQTIVWHTPLPLTNVTLRAGATTETAVDLSSWLTGELTGSLTCNGTPVANAEMGVEIARPVPGYPRARTFTTAATDAKGRFRIRAREGTVRLAVDRHDREGLASQTMWVRSPTTAFLPAGGHVAQDFAVDACPLQLRVLDAAGTPVEGVSLFLQRDDPTLSHTTAPSDRDGRIACDVEAASFAVQVLPARLQDRDAQQQVFRAAKGDPDPLAAHRLLLGNVTGRPGTTVALDVRLPPEWAR